MGQGPISNNKYDAAGDEPSVPFSRWLRQKGWRRTTGWWIRQRRWVTTTSIAGRLYLSPNEIAEFSQRARRGDFEHVPAAETKLRREKKRAKAKTQPTEQQHPVGPTTPRQLELDL